MENQTTQSKPKADEEREAKPAFECSALLPCPFCGAPGILEKNTCWPFGSYYVPRCCRCACKLSGRDTKEEAATIWNLRQGNNASATPVADPNRS